jgi:hypothetical protein
MGKLPMPRGDASVRKLLRRSLTFISLLCLVAMVVLWVRSRWMFDSMSVFWGHNTETGWKWVNIGLTSRLEGCVVSGERLPDENPPLDRTHYGPVIEVHSRGRMRLDDEAPPGPWNRFGFFHEKYTSVAVGAPPSLLYHAIGFPHWFLLPFFAAMPLMGLRRTWIRRRRARMGLCVKCGYDLRASPDRCPECGATVDRGMGNLPMHSAAKQHA